MKEWLQDQLEDSLDSLSDAFQLSNLVDSAIDSTGESLSNLREMDSLLKEIDQSVDSISKADYSKMSEQAFKSADAYGATALAYLSSFQEMSKAGYFNSDELSDLSLMAQSATDMTGELADQFIIATDQAYQMSGNVREITHALDGINTIAHENSLSMSQLSLGIQLVSETAAQCGLKINETAAAIATTMLSTDLSETDIAAAFEEILTVFQTFSSDSDLTNTVGLKSLQTLCDALDISMQSLRQNIEGMENPMDILSSLAQIYLSLDSYDMGNIQLSDAFENENTSQVFQAMMENWNLYEELLLQYQSSIGSLQADAVSNLDSWEGSLNQLSNTWTSTLNNLSNSDAMIGLIHVLNELLNVVNNVTKGLGLFGTAGLAIGGIMGANNIGKTHIKNGFHFAYMPVTPSISSIIV